MNGRSTTGVTATRGLWQQGYDDSPEALRELEWGLRFTPAVCMLGAVLGLALHEPRIHFALAALGIGLCFVQGWELAAYVLGGLLVSLQLVVISTHFCLASWMVERGLRLLGRWSEPIEVERAREIVHAGGLLVDVRSPGEYACGHLPGAINLPVDEVAERLGELGEKELVVYCRSGLRSRRAVGVLGRCGCARVHDLGAMGRWGGAGREPRGLRA